MSETPFENWFRNEPRLRGVTLSRGPRDLPPPEGQECTVEESMKIAGDITQEDVRKMQDEFEARERIFNVILPIMKELGCNVGEAIKVAQAAGALPGDHEPLT